MTWRVMRTRSVRITLGALITSAAAAAWSLARAVHVAPAPDPAQVPSLTVPETAPAAADTSAAWHLAVAKNPFRPDRRPPTQRFRMPGERVAAQSPVAALPATTRLNGTVVLPSGGYAIIAQPGRPDQIIRVGERFGGLTLRAVERGRAVFVAANGSSVVVTVPQGGN